MSNTLLISVIICVGVVFIMINQINKLTSNIDAKLDVHQPSIYASFAAFIQEVIRNIKQDLDSSKDTPNAKYKLLEGKDEEKALEFLANLIRKLVFFETMNAKRKSAKEVESELFALLSSLDDFLHQDVQNGQNLADELRERFAKEFENLKRS